MKTVLYCHDLPFFYSSKGEVFSSGFSDQYFYRFVDAGFSRVSVLSRSAPLKSDQEASKLESLSDRYLILNKFLRSSYFRLFSPLSMYRILCLIRKADVVVLSTPSVIGFYVSFWCFALRKKYVCEVAGDYTAFSKSKFGGGVTFFLKFYMPFVVRKAVGATYVTSDLASRYFNDNSLIGSNVNLNRLSPRESYSISSSDGTVNVGFVGGLVERKGIETIILAAKKIKIEGWKVRYHIIGGHADRDWIDFCRSHGLQEEFNFYGLLRRQEIEPILKCMDIYIQPSFSEGVPRATIEAMSHGLPVIATSLPGFKEILDLEFLVAPGDSIALAEKIKLLISSSVERSRLGSNNINRAADFLYDNMHERRVYFYRGLLSN